MGRAGTVVAALVASASMMSACGRPPSPVGPTALSAAPSAAGAWTASAPAATAPATLSHTVSGATVTLTWGAPASGPGPSSYVIEAGSATALADLAVLETGNAATTLTVPNVPSGSYYVRVRARTSTGLSEASNEIVVTVGGSGDPAPVLSASIVDLSGTYDPATGRLASLNCRFKFATDPNDRWCFGAFASARTGKASVSYDYKVAAGSLVYAAAGGIVTRIDADTSPLYPGEFEIETRASAGATYLVIYDHVKNPQVALGSTVSPGTVLGTAGIHTSDAGTWGRVELQINQITQRTPTIRSISVCPRTFGTAAFNQAHEAALAAHNAANPGFTATSVCLQESVGTP